MRRTIPRALASIVLVAACSCTVDSVTADGALYAIEENTDRLVRIDLDTYEKTVIGPLGVPFNYGGLAYESVSQRMYASVGSAGRLFYEVEIDTGGTWFLGDLERPGMCGLAFDSSTGILYATDVSDPASLWTVDPSNVVRTPVGQMFSPVTSLTYDSRNDRLIGLDNETSSLWEINRVDGTQTRIFQGAYTNNGGLAYDPERNVLWNLDWSGTLLYFDIDNNFARTVVQTGFGAHDGLTYVDECSRLTVSNLVAGEEATWNVIGARGGEEIAITYGLRPGETILNGQASYCATFAIEGILPSRVICRANADAGGTLTCSRRVPDGASGVRVLMQAAQANTCPYECMSNIVEQVIQ